MPIKSNKVAANKTAVILDTIKNVRFKHDDLQKINKYAATLDRSASFVIRQAIREKVG